MLGKELQLPHCFPRWELPYVANWRYQAGSSISAQGVRDGEEMPCFQPRSAVTWQPPAPDSSATCSLGQAAEHLTGYVVGPSGCESWWLQWVGCTEVVASSLWVSLDCCSGLHDNTSEGCWEDYMKGRVEIPTTEPGAQGAPVVLVTGVCVLTPSLPSRPSSDAAASARVSRTPAKPSVGFSSVFRVYSLRLTSAPRLRGAGRCSSGLSYTVYHLGLRMLSSII